MNPWVQTDGFIADEVMSGTVRLADAQLRGQIDVNGHEPTLALDKQRSYLCNDAASPRIDRLGFLQL